MNKDNQPEKNTNESINNLFSNNNNLEKHNSKTGYNRITKLNNHEESQKYIKEMHELADKNELKNNVIVLGFGIFIVSIITFSILMNTSFMKPKADVPAKELVTKNTIDNSSTKNNAINSIETPSKIYEYLNVETNRTSALKNAVNLNNGRQNGVTVYLLSEILRSNTLDIPENTSNVETLMKTLTSMDWEKNTDFTQLEKGDICFTSDMPDNPGVPGHTYVFMGWVEDGKTDYAYVCDGQVEEYGNILHKRNISIATPQKDKFSFFLRK